MATSGPGRGTARRPARDFVFVVSRRTCTLSGQYPAFLPHGELSDYPCSYLGRRRFRRSLRYSLLRSTSDPGQVSARGSVCIEGSPFRSSPPRCRQSETPELLGVGGGRVGAEEFGVELR